MNDSEVWPGVQGHAGSTGTDTNTLRALRDKQFGQRQARSSHVLCFEGVPPTSSVFVLFSSLLLCAEGDESNFYVHYHLYDDHSTGVFVLVPSQCGIKVFEVFIHLNFFRGNGFELLLKRWLTLELKFHFYSKKKERWQGFPNLGACCVSMVTGICVGDGFWQRCNQLPWWLGVVAGSRWRPTTVTAATRWQVFSVWGCRWETGHLSSRWSTPVETLSHLGATSHRPSGRGVEPLNTSDSAAERERGIKKERETYCK